MKNVVTHLSLYSFSHALVDAACATTLFAIVDQDLYSAEYLFYLIVGYNVLAFATQPIFGLVVDKFNLPATAGALGAAMVAAATLLLTLPPLAAILAGLGNALFHVGGGVVSLRLDPGKAALPGIFVAPGALGLTLGIWIGQSGRFLAWPFILLLIMAGALMLALPKLQTTSRPRLRGNMRGFESVILLLLLSIAIRGVVGLSLVLPWKSDPVLLLALTGAVVVGKATGGILGDRWGWMRVAIGGLAIAAPLLAFFNLNPPLAVLGAVLFNMTMPITLTALANMLPGHTGFAFGLTTLALIIGALPTFTPLKQATSGEWFLFVIILASIGALYTGLRLYFDRFHDPGF